jgi:hypothetical protein
VIYRLKYRVLTAATTIRNVGMCVAFVAGSYLASGLVNASPVIQPNLTAPRKQTILVAPVSSEESDMLRDTPSRNPAADIALPPRITQSL